VSDASTTRAPWLPLVRVADVPLPGKPVRFDYQALDAARGNLIIAHMNGASVVVVKARDGSLVKVVPGIPTPRGVVVADNVGRIFVTSSPDKLVILDATSFKVIAHVTTGSAPDGDGWDAKDRVVAVSDQGDGAVSLIAKSGSGARRQVSLGTETGNVVFDAKRGVFWVTVVKASPPNQLVSIDPLTAKVKGSIPLPGCSGAHGLCIHPDGGSAFVACESNSKVVRVALVGTSHAVDIAPSGADPDVLAIDRGLGWLYVAAESGDLRVFDIKKPGLVSIDSEHPGDASHSVAVDPTTHHVFFPLEKGPAGKPVLRIMKPAGT
jgi:DNA-binding beta-propeller fold protein YncE